MAIEQAVYVMKGPHSTTSGTDRHFALKTSGPNDGELGEPAVMLVR